MSINIYETEDYAGLVKLFIDNGLEFSENDEVSTDLVKCWIASPSSVSRDDGADADISGGCVLALRQGRFICDGIAVNPSGRGQGLGRRLMALLTDEAKAQGADALYLVAREPDFFSALGFINTPREEAPVFFECFTCPQYEVSCRPQVMRLMLGD